MIEALARWMASSEKWQRNKDGMGVTIKAFSTKEEKYFFDLDVPEPYAKYIPALQSLLSDICKQGERYMVSSISLAYVAEEDQESHLKEIANMHRMKSHVLLRTLMEDGVEPFTAMYQEELGNLKVAYLKRHVKKEGDLWRLPDGSVSEDGIVWMDHNGFSYYDYYNEIAVTEYQAAI